MGNRNQLNNKKKLQISEHDILKDFLLKNKYEYVSDIGKGPSSQVVLAFQIKKQCYHAIMIFIQSNLAALEKYEKQMKIFKKLKNEKYILQFIKRFEDEQKGLIGIAMEFCDGNLADILCQNQLDILQIQAMTYQILQGLLKVQKFGLIHGNIKSSNILYSKFKNEFLIADFGLSKNNGNLISQSCDQIYHSNYAFKETVEIQEPSSIEGDIFMIGLLLVETFLKRPLTPQEKIDINRQNIFSVFPDLKSSKHIQFIKKIISPMIDPSKQVRIEPAELIQNLKEFHINEEQLKQLKLQQRHRKFQTSHIEDILKGIHYDILIINLVWNDFIADGPKQIGLSLEKCHNISQLSLNLAYNSINEEGAKYISTGISKCQNITSLNLNLFKNKICAKSAKHIGTILEKCQKITQLQLNLGINNICAEGAKNIAINLERCLNLSTLDLIINDNNITEEGTKFLAKCFQKLKNVITLNLDLSKNNIKAAGSKIIISALQKCYNLEALSISLSNNNIENHEEAVIETNINEQSELKILNINFSFNQISTKIASYIGINLQMYQNLTFLNLNLEQTQLNEENAQNIISGISKCVKITNLNINLTQNFLQVQGTKIVVESLEKLQNMSILKLNLFENSITEEGAKYIGNSLKKCMNISFLDLDLSKNNIGLEGLREIGNSLKYCHKIHFLKINHQECLFTQKQANLKQSFKKMKRLVEMQINCSQ